VEALARHLPGSTTSGVAAGLHLLAHLAPGQDERAVLERARSQGVGMYGLCEHSIHPRPPALLLGYGRIAEAAIEPGVRELARAVR